MTSRARRSALTAALVGSLLLAGCGSDDDAATDRSTTTAATETTTTESATTTAAETTTTEAASPAEQPESAIWPFAADDLRYDDPVEAAAGFAVDYLGFVDPVVGEFASGDSRSGEVDIQPADQGPVTTVLVRQVTDDDTWWVIGAATAALQLESPEVLDAISSPVSLSGQSTAFEANVNVEIRQDGSTDPLAEDFVMGGSMGEMGPFAKDITFAAPSAGAGAIILQTFSMEDGRIWEASVLRVSFG